MPIEPSITPESPVTPTYWVDMIDVAIELPRGSRGVAGPPGIGWVSGEGPPTMPPDAEGSLYIDLESGDVYVVQGGQWINAGSLMGPTGTVEEHDHAYLPLTAGPDKPLTGKLHGNAGAVFDNTIQVGTPGVGDNPAQPKDAINVEYLNGLLDGKINLSRFFGQRHKQNEAIFTTHDWNNALEQGIYQQKGGSGVPSAGKHVPPGTVGDTIGLVQKVTTEILTQLIYDVDRDLMFIRHKMSGEWTNWFSVNHITSFNKPPEKNEPARARIGQEAGSSWTNGQIWIQLENKPAPEPEPNR